MNRRKTELKRLPLEIPASSLYLETDANEQHRHSLSLVNQMAQDAAAYIDHAQRELAITPTRVESKSNGKPLFGTEDAYYDTWLKARNQTSEKRQIRDNIAQAQNKRKEQQAAVDPRLKSGYIPAYNVDQDIDLNDVFQCTL